MVIVSRKEKLRMEKKTTLHIWQPANTPPSVCMPPTKEDALKARSKLIESTL